VQTLDAWDARVRAYREAHPSSPAYLVLNGDILDFWSADVVPGASPASDLIVRTVGGVPRAYLPKPAVSARMDRILAAHPAVFDRVRSWVTAQGLNFLVYVCGNHDDHLVRYQLGGALVQRLGGPRGVFAAKSAYFPQLKLLIEHGHRSDDHNRTDPSFDHGIGCLGELIVALLINPTERGGVAPLLSLADDTGAPVDVAAAHGLKDTADALRAEYGKLQAGRSAAPKLYDRVLREIDNIENGGAEDILIDYAMRHSAASADAMRDVGGAIEEIQKIWTRDEFQTLAIRVGGRFGAWFPPYARAHVVDESFAADHPADLGFDPAHGLHGQRSMKVHVVGHTHRPALTTPPLAGDDVPAQHVNTGTGQNMWRLHDRCFGIDLLSDHGLTQPQDHITPVSADQYCLIYLALAGEEPGKRLKIHVEGGSYRMPQSYSPLNAGQPIAGGLTPQGTNTLDL
jgi:UDP-2,3-diacylglucosamine pyrophosphatase LpxH